MPQTTLVPKTQTRSFMVFSGLMILVLSTIVVGLFSRNVEIRDESEAMPTRRIQDLVSLLRQAEDKQDALQKELDVIRKKGTTASNPATTLPGAEDPELKRLYSIAGYTPISGKGLVITLTDSKKQNTDDAHADPNSGKLQADDLLKLINELKSGGATAISINDQRLIVTSEIVTAGNSIEVNQTRLSQPVVVRALGNPDVLVATLKIRGGILEYLDFFGIQVKTDKSNNITLPAYKGPLPS